MIKTVYVYAILFVTLMMTIGGSVAALSAASDLISPPSFFQSFDAFKETHSKLSDQEMKPSYEQAVEDDLQRTRNRAVHSLIQSIGWIIIPFPVFLYFQRKRGE